MEAFTLTWWLSVLAVGWFCYYMIVKLWEQRAISIENMRLQEMTEVVQDPDFQWRSKEEADFFFAALHAQEYDVAYQVLLVNKEASDV